MQIARDCLIVSYPVSRAAVWLGMIEPHPTEMLVAAFAMEDSGETLYRVYGVLEKKADVGQLKLVYIQDCWHTQVKLGRPLLRLPREASESAFCLLYTLAMVEGYRRKALLTRSFQPQDNETLMDLPMSVRWVRY